MQARANYERLIDVIQELSLARSLEGVIEIVRLEARRLTGADGATFVLRDGDQCFYADEHAIAPLWKGRRFPMEACISGWVMLKRKPAVIPDIYADERIPADAYRPTFVKSLVMVPIRTIDPVGAIGNYWAQERPPTPDEVAILQALADSTAVALENVRVHQELENRVQTRTVELREKVDELGRALQETRRLRGLIPICAHCKSIREDDGSWHRLERYLSAHTDAAFSHGICPECYSRNYSDCSAAPMT